MHTLRRCIVSVGLLVATTAATAEPPYAIFLTRPVEVGHSFHVRATGSTDIATTMVAEGRPEKPDIVNLTVTFDAVGRVIKVDDEGRPIAIAYAVNACTMKRHGYTSTIIRQGATLIARQGRTRTKFFVKKKHFTELEQRALGTVAGVGASMVTKDEMFGTDRPRNVGEQWPINSEAVAMEFQRFTPQQVEPGNITGSTALLDLIDFEGRQCQVVRTRIDCTGALPGFEAVPRGTRLKSAEIKITTYDLLPVDTQQPRSAAKRRVELEIVFSGKTAGRAIEARVVGTVESEHTYSSITPVQAAVEP